PPPPPRPPPGVAARPRPPLCGVAPLPPPPPPPPPPLPHLLAVPRQRRVAVALGVLRLGHWGVHPRAARRGLGCLDVLQADEPALGQPLPPGSAVAIVDLGAQPRGLPGVAAAARHRLRGRPPPRPP